MQLTKQMLLSLRPVPVRVEKSQGEMDGANEQGYHGMQKTSKGFNFFTKSAL